MKARLTIEVPDDFEKGDYVRCNQGYTSRFNVEWCTAINSQCNAQRCPLEIQEDKE